jgi:hypothetical protein
MLRRPVLVRAGGAMTVMLQTPSTALLRAAAFHVHFLNSPPSNASDATKHATMLLMEPAAISSGNLLHKCI